MRWTSLLGVLAFPWRRAALALLLAGLAMNLALPSVGAAFIFPPPPPDIDPDIRITDVTLSEPTSGAVTARFSVRLGGLIFQPVTVGFQTADGTARSPTATTTPPRAPSPSSRAASRTRPGPSPSRSRPTRSPSWTRPSSST
jgi:hypothetical protein